MKERRRETLCCALLVVLAAVTAAAAVASASVTHDQQHPHRHHAVGGSRRERSHQESNQGAHPSKGEHVRPNAIQVDTTKITPQRLFISPNFTSVQAQTGATAILHCEVNDVGDNMISWIRRKDYYLLTVGLLTYSSDQRFFTAHAKGPQDWALHVRHASVADAGLYECQVSTHPPSSLFVELQLVEAHADIIGGPDKIVKSGSPLRMSCVLRRSTEPPAYVFWYHGPRMINYDLGVAVRHGRQGSELLIPQAELFHAGNYSCVPSNARPSSVTVHVLQSEKPAAMQHGSKSSCTSLHLHALLILFGIAATVR